MIQSNTLEEGIFLILSSFVLLFLGYFKYKKYYTLKNTPRSKIRSMEAGFVEVKGKLKEKEEVVKNPVNDKDCLYYDIHVEEKREDVGEVNEEGGWFWLLISLCLQMLGKRNPTDWITVEEREEYKDMIVDDGTGEVLVKPNGADFKIKEDNISIEKKGMKEGEIPEYLEDSVVTGRLYRIKTRWIKPGQTGLITGSAKVRDDVNSKVNEDNLYIGDTKSVLPDFLEPYLGSYFGLPYIISNFSTQEKLTKKYKIKIYILLAIGFAAFGFGLFLLSTLL